MSAFLVLSPLLASAQTAEPALVYPDPAPERLAPAEIVQSFEPGVFLEGVAFNRAGTLFVTVQRGGEGSVWYRTTSGQTGTYDRGGGNLALHPDGTMYATAFEGDFTDPASITVRLVRLGKSGRSQSVLTFPPGANANGIAFDARGNLYAADSALGRIWRVQAGTAVPELWLADELLLPKGPPGIPGANGIEVFRGAVYVVNSSSGDFVRVPILPYGGAGTPSVAASGVTGDGFAFDGQGNAYVTTHPFNRLYKVAPDGSKTVVGTGENGIIGATDATFAVAGEDRKNLYVVTDGGAFLQLVPPEFAKRFPQDKGTPSVVKLLIDR